MSVEFKNSAPVLKAPKDWPTWLRALQRKAAGEPDLWQYLRTDNRKPWPVEPVEQTLEECREIAIEQYGPCPEAPAPPEGRSGRHGSSASGIGGIDISRAILDWTEKVNARELTLYNSQASRINRQTQAYNSVMKKKATIREWVMDTVDTALQTTYCPPLEDLHEWFDRLQHYGIGGEREEYERTKALFLKAVKPRNNDRNMEEVINAWEQAMGLGVAVGLLVTTSPREWFQALIDSFPAGSPHLLSLTSQYTCRKVEKEKITYQEVASAMRENLHLHKSDHRKGFKSGSAFHAGTIDPQPESDPDGQQEAQRPQPRPQTPKRRLGNPRQVNPRGRGGSQQGGTKRPRSEIETDETGKAVCRACRGPNHNMSSCWVVFPDKRPAEYTPSRIGYEIFTNQLISDPDFAAEVRRMRGKNQSTGRQGENERRDNEA